MTLLDFVKVRNPVHQQAVMYLFAMGVWPDDFPVPPDLQCTPRDIELIARELCEQYRDEMEYWKSAAIHLADMHAANLHDVEQKSCPKSRKKRYKSIMLLAAEWLLGTGSIKYYRTVEAVVARLKDHAEKIGV